MNQTCVNLHSYMLQVGEPAFVVDAIVVASTPLLNAFASATCSSLYWHSVCIAFVVCVSSLRYHVIIIKAEHRRAARNLSAQLQPRNKCCGGILPFHRLLSSSASINMSSNPDDPSNNPYNEGGARSSPARQSSVWFCHSCQRDFNSNQLLHTPDPSCPYCHGDFVEETGCVSLLSCVLRNG